MQETCLEIEQDHLLLEIIANKWCRKERNVFIEEASSLIHK